MTDHDVRPTTGPIPSDAPFPPADLDTLRGAELLSPLDTLFARRVGALVEETRPDVLLAAALASHATMAGDICARLDRVPAPLRAAARWPEPHAWRETLRTSPLVGNGRPATPLVLEERRLYLHRYWSYERELAAALLARATTRDADVDQAQVRAGLDRLFGPAGAAGDDVDWQRVAAYVAVTRGLTLLCGGPGTGKTSTVVRILALLVELALAAGRPAPDVLLLAPTGKAAQRMVESIVGARARLPVDDAVRAAIPTDASTIHRALGPLRDRPTRFRRDRTNPLMADVVVVDEASMVDLALMAKLVDAVRPDARLVLLGDRDQLASVEAGAVLADMAGQADDVGFGAALRRGLSEGAGVRLSAPRRSARGAGGKTGDGSPLGDCVVTLRKSWRFDSGGGIGALAKAANVGDHAGAEAVLRDLAMPQARRLSTPKRERMLAALRPLLLEGFGEAARAATPEAALKALEGFRVLCAVRRGQWGVEGLNALVEEVLRGEGLIGTNEDARWFRGRPIIVTANAYDVGLFNGDIGVVHPDPESGGAPRVFFPAADGTLRALAPARLPEHETAWAMTVHKSQGSEFRRVLLMLPPRHVPILTRELFYTGVTRAREEVLVMAHPDVLADTIGARVERSSGLAERLWR